ncbi:MAG: O-antigen ligase family protein [Opitutaceae bacterium]
MRSIGISDSRGGLLAVTAAACFFSGVRFIGHRKIVWPALFWGSLRVATITILLLATGFVGRMTPSYTRGDASAMNRLDLWRGGAVLAASAPLLGWGDGESGRAYMNWFQSADRTEGYATMGRQGCQRTGDRCQESVSLMGAARSGRSGTARGHHVSEKKQASCLGFLAYRLG